MANKHVKKMLTIVNHQGITNQNPNEIPPHPLQDGYNKKLTIISVGENAETPQALLI